MPKDRAVPAELGELRLGPTELRLQLLTGDAVVAASPTPAACWPRDGRR